MYLLHEMKMEKKKKRKRSLLDDISSLHKMFCEEYPDHPIGKTKFFELRPFWIIPVQKNHRFACVATMSILTYY